MTKTKRIPTFVKPHQHVTSWMTPTSSSSCSSSFEYLLFLGRPPALRGFQLTWFITNWFALPYKEATRNLDSILTALIKRWPPINSLSQFHNHHLWIGFIKSVASAGRPAFWLVVWYCTRRWRWGQWQLDVQRPFDCDWMELGGSGRFQWDFNWLKAGIDDQSGL